MFEVPKVVVRSFDEKHCSPASSKQSLASGVRFAADSSVRSIVGAAAGSFVEGSKANLFSEKKRGNFQFFQETSKWKN